MSFTITREDSTFSIEGAYMHYHCEVVIPPTDKIKEAVETALKQFDEHEDNSYHAFWDWWVIGGRWSGSKLMARFGDDKIRAFRDELNAKNVTISGFQAGKPELKPSSQIPMVDALWKERFPDAGDGACPLFKHANDMYSDETSTWGDILDLSDAPPDLSAARVIFTDAENKPTFMLSQGIWNGVNFEETSWKGKFKKALRMYRKYIRVYSTEWKKKNTAMDDWLAVTVDYHS